MREERERGRPRRKSEAGTHTRIERVARRRERARGTNTQRRQAERETQRRGNGDRTEMEGEVGRQRCERQAQQAGAAGRRSRQAHTRCVRSAIFLDGVAGATGAGGGTRRGNGRGTSE